MQRQSLLCSKGTFNSINYPDGIRDLGFPLLANILPSRTYFRFHLKRTKGSSSTLNLCLDAQKRNIKIKSMPQNIPGGLLDEDDDVCPVECVREFKTDLEFITILEKAKGTGSLVVVDFYRTSCGSCKYIEQGFSKLCKGTGSEEAPVIFLKHNVIDEYDEQSEVAERLRIKMDFNRCRQCLCSTSIKMESCWKHSQPETRSGFLMPFVNIILLLKEARLQVLLLRSIRCTVLLGNTESEFCMGVSA